MCFRKRETKNAEASMACGTNREWFCLKTEDRKRGEEKLKTSIAQRTYYYYHIMLRMNCGDSRTYILYDP